MKYFLVFAILVVFASSILIKDAPEQVTYVKAPQAQTQVGNSSQQERPTQFADKLYQATALLYRRDKSGDLSFSCTATVFEKTDIGYWAVTARHCVKDDSTRYFLVFDEGADAPYVRADVLFISPDTDAAVLGLVTSQDLPVIPLGDERIEPIGAPIVNMASPSGLGKLFFHGFIVSKKLVEREQNKSEIVDPIVLQIPSAGGSSGSAVVSESQKAIVGILVAIYIPQNGGVIATLAVPATQVSKNVADFKAGKLVQWKPKVKLGLFDFFNGNRN